jgi:hypothetical protein
VGKRLLEEEQQEQKGEEMAEAVQSILEIGGCVL